MGVYGRYGENGKYDAPYFVEIDKKGFYRYVWDSTESEWYPEVSGRYSCFIENGTWLEVAELPEKPWKW